MSFVGRDDGRLHEKRKFTRKSTLFQILIVFDGMTVGFPTRISITLKIWGFRVKFIMRPVKIVGSPQSWPQKVAQMRD